ncbi:hypothetical protein LTR37_003460 [Vermiconidia calcicola]|uniref:Uncharacterized protein n=1 Tax=Vermiconidia calcicola TaxID=1690605 RepID=A0ACC3NPL2_9PEZI|nr:hypothetical protein LTR37_003460 [Vermiconidia calcicola]
MAFVANVAIIPSIGSPDALIRTFHLVWPEDALQHGVGLQAVSALGKTIVLTDRHLGCLHFSDVKYISVSHVWDKLISDVQYQGPVINGDSNLEHSKVANLVFQTVIDIYEGIAEQVCEPFEVWHDYVSVPQWANEYKMRILLKIPDIYNCFYFTVVDMHDVDRSALNDIRAPGGDQTETHLRGITSVCNSQYFRRVWTAMEYIRSQNVRVMVRGYKLLDAGDDLFMGEIVRTWEAEVALHGNVFKVEDMAGRRVNLLPWQLGPLQDLKKLKRTSFGAAYEILALRGCTAPLDFFYALLGLVRTTFRDETLSSDPRDARWQIIKGCMENQDYSPVLMVPQMTHHFPGTDNGLWDIRAWGLGFMVSPSKHELFVRGQRAAFKVQPIGNISFIERCPFDLDHMSVFERNVRVVLGFTGADLESFVGNLGMRIFAQDPRAMLKHLGSNGTREACQDTLSELYMSESSWSRASLERLANDLGLTDFDLPAFNETHNDVRRPNPDNPFRLTRRTPIERFTAHGNTIHLIEHSAIVGTTCLACQQPFLVRAALYKPDADVYGAMTFRIPGLEYVYSLPNGLGIILQGSQIVGRFMYGCPCCAGFELQEIEIDLPDIPMPSPNTEQYGEVLWS